MSWKQLHRKYMTPELFKHYLKIQTTRQAWLNFFSWFIVPETEEYWMGILRHYHPKSRNLKPFKIYWDSRNVSNEYTAFASPSALLIHDFSLSLWSQFWSSCFLLPHITISIKKAFSETRFMSLDVTVFFSSRSGMVDESYLTMALLHTTGWKYILK